MLAASAMLSPSCFTSRKAVRWFSGIDASVSSTSSTDLCPSKIASGEASPELSSSPTSSSETCWRLLRSRRSFASRKRRRVIA